MASDLMRAKKGELLATDTPEVDFALVLSRVIDQVKKDPAELRNAVYEVARVKLQREAWDRNPPMDLREMRRLMVALETAIDRVEAISSKQDELQALRSLDRLIENLDKSHTAVPANPGDAVLVIDHAAVAIDYRSRLIGFFARVKRGQQAFSQLWRRHQAAPTRRVLVMAILVLATYAVFYTTSELFRSRDADVRSPHRATNVAESDTTQAAKSAGRTTPTTALVAERPVAGLRPPSRDFPLPSVYGIYAVSKGELHELDALPGRVPDQRLFMSATISKPSRAILPDGHVSFVAFRRDLATSAPDRVSIRVIAKIKRGMTFNSGGRATTTSLDELWAIRNVSYDLRVAPLSDSPEMLVMRPDNLDFVLTPGRYGMVLNGLAYDFTVAGEPTAAAHCLERTEAANGTFYSECRNP